MRYHPIFVTKQSFCCLWSEIIPMRIYLDTGVHSLLKNSNMLMRYTHALKTWEKADSYRSSFGHGVLGVHKPSIGLNLSKWSIWLGQGSVTLFQPPLGQKIAQHKRDFSHYKIFLEMEKEGLVGKFCIILPSHNCD